MVSKPILQKAIREMFDGHEHLDAPEHAQKLSIACETIYGLTSNQLLKSVSTETFRALLDSCISLIEKSPDGNWGNVKEGQSKVEEELEAEKDATEAPVKDKEPLVRS